MSTTTVTEPVIDWGRLAGAKDVFEKTLLRFEMAGRLLPGTTGAVVDRVRVICNQAGVGQEPDVVAHIYRLIEGDGAHAFEFEGRSTSAPARPSHPVIAPFLDPSFSHSRKEHPLQFCLRLFGDRIQDTDRTYAQWAADLATKTPAGMLSEVSRRTTSREHNDHLTREHQVAKPSNLTRLEGVLTSKFPEVPPHRREELAEAVDRQWSGLHREADHQIVRRVAGFLSVAPTSRKYTQDGSPIDRKDSRHQEPAPRSEPDPDRGSFPRM